MGRAGRPGGERPRLDAAADPLLQDTGLVEGRRADHEVQHCPVRDHVDGLTTVAHHTVDPVAVAYLLAQQGDRGLGDQG
ncbi:MAG: hypothetical protein ACRD2C_23465 [Acidimicrobiales bacterium]